MAVTDLLARLLGRRKDDDPVTRGRRAVRDLRTGSAATSGWLLAGSGDGSELGGADAAGAGGGGGGDGGC